MPSQHHPVSDFVTISVAGLILVQVADREKFRAINLPIRDHGIQTNDRHLVTKRVEQTDLAIVFFHWPSSELASEVMKKPEEGKTL